MASSAVTIIGTLAAIRPVLRRAHGWRWPLLAVRALWVSRRVVQRTRWAIRTDAEARLVGTLALFPALVLAARRTPGADERAFGRELVAAAFVERRRRLEADLGGTGARERWHAFVDRLFLQGADGFNEVECLAIDEDRFHVRVTRCLAADLAREVAMPELAQALCEQSAESCRQLLPTHVFHRDGAPDRTLAYGHRHCDYVWESREAQRAGDGPAANRPATAQPPTVPTRESGRAERSRLADYSAANAERADLDGRP